jgi:E2/UBC family protein E
VLDVDLLIKLPPGFPDAQPDMFWVHPAVKTANGCLPRATCVERLKAKKAIEQALYSAGVRFDDPFRSENGCYRLTVFAYVT